MHEPLAGPAICDTEGVEQLSVAVAAFHVIFVQQVPPLVGVFDIFAGQVMTGGVMSFAQGSVIVTVTVAIFDVPFDATTLYVN